MKQIKAELMKCSPRPDTKMLVVGHKITKELCQEIGAEDFTDEFLGNGRQGIGPWGTARTGPT